MRELFDKIAEKWAVISSAPRIYIGTVIAIVIAVWGIVAWSYSSILQNKDSQIELLRDLLAGFQDKLQGASPDQVANELEELRAKVAALEHPPHERDKLYFNGRPIGSGTGVYVDTQNNTVTFRTLEMAEDIITSPV
jgi:hypothetical protein